MNCKCYHDDLNFLGKHGVCWGTKECEACSCGGDESKCDFYQCVRDRASQKLTNADKYFRSATDEEIAEFLSSIEWGHIPKSKKVWLEWLRQEADHE